MSIEINLSEVNPTARPRDAIHVAVIQVFAGASDLEPGQRVYIAGDSLGFPIVYPWKMSSRVHPDGVVSPFVFVDKKIKQGDTFWMIMNPSSVTDLRHAWSHPSVPEDSDVSPDTYDDECRGCNG